MTVPSSATWPAFLTTRDAGAARDVLTEYFALHADGAVAYTGAKFDTLAAGANTGTDRNRLTSDDLTAVTCLSVTVTARAAIRILEDQAADITDLLGRLDPTLTFIAATDHDLAPQAPLTQLWRLLTTARDGIGPTIASKLLARKRPALAPIYDRAVAYATGCSPGTYWPHLRARLSEATSERPQLWQWLADVTATVPTAAHITPLRALDICLWLPDAKRRRPSA